MLDINATCEDLGLKCLQLLSMQALSGCDTSYSYGKGKISALNTLLTRDFPGLAHVLSEVGITQADLMEAAAPFFSALCRPTSRDIHGVYLFHSFHEEEEITQDYGLTTNFCKLVAACAAAHLQVMLWKAADREAPPDESTA